MKKYQNNFLIATLAKTGVKIELEARKLVKKKLCDILLLVLDKNTWVLLIISLLTKIEFYKRFQ